MMTRVTDNTEALAAFVATRAEIGALLARLAALIAEHVGVGPDEVNWATSARSDTMRAS